MYFLDTLVSCLRYKGDGEGSAQEADDREHPEGALRPYGVGHGLVADRLHEVCQSGQRHGDGGD